MKRKFIEWLSVTLTLAAALASTGCDLGDLFGSKDGDTPSDNATVKVYDGVKKGTTPEYLYIDLENPDAPSSTGTDTGWDIMITGQKEILTNSGVTATAAGSSGKGGVVFSGRTDISQGISVAEAAALFAADARDGADYSYWLKSSSTSTAKEATGNAISFPGYAKTEDKDGTTSARAWVFATDADFSLGHAYAKWERMAPNYSGYTNNVYIVQSGDGSAYYRLQIVTVDYSKSTETHYTFKIKFQKLG